MIHAPTDLLHRLRSHGQDHVLSGWDTLTPTVRSALVNQLVGIDLAELDQLFRRKSEPHAVLPARDRLAPIPVEDISDLPASARARGEDALRAGAVAALVVAGGQGSRLGFDQPKGMFPVGPLTGASLFELHAEQVLALSQRYGRPMPFLVMTSPATHDETVAFFTEKQYFGLARDQVAFFQQGTMPALDLTTGRLLLERPGSLFLSPNGHGGTLTALADTGLLADLKSRGVEQVFYFQVDNPLVAIADPAFVGRHLETGAEVSSKVVFKDRPEEKVGILALVDGRCSILEYSDLPAEMQAERETNGELRYRAGNPAIHLFQVSFLERVTQGATRLAYHVARKKVPFYDPDRGQVVTPDQENALKFEMFVFDALPLAERWLAVRVRREDEFAPLKNATGPDSPATVRQLLLGRAARWLAQAGVPVPDGVPVEIRARFALEAAEVVQRIPPGFQITGPSLLSDYPLRGV